MKSNEMRDYYRDTIKVCRGYLTEVISSYLDGLRALHVSANSGTDDADALHEALVGIYANIPVLGKHLAETLRLWQKSGSTLEDLCEACGADYEKFKHIPSKVSFVEIIEEQQLDFANAGTRPPTWQDDCPLTLGIMSIAHQEQIRSGL